MKKIFTLLVSLGSLGSVFAQSGHFGHDSKDMAFIKAPYNTRYVVSNTTDAGYFNKDKEIRLVNREFDSKIMAVRHNRFLRPMEKNMQIRMLDAQRAGQIRAINERFDGRFHRDFKVRDHRKW